MNESIPDRRICFFGDSFVNGTNDPECLGWCGRLMKTAITRGQNITYYNLGVRRDTSADIAARWLLEAKLRLPKDTNNLLVFSFGTNDTHNQDGLRRVSLVETLRHAEIILGVASALERFIIYPNRKGIPKSFDL